MAFVRQLGVAVVLHLGDAAVWYGGGTLFCCVVGLCCVVVGLCCIISGAGEQ